MNQPLDQARNYARSAQESEGRETIAARTWENRRNDLQAQVEDITLGVDSIDSRLTEITGCNRTTTDDNYFACVEQAIQGFAQCLPSTGSQQVFDNCLQQANNTGTGLLRQTLQDVRSAYLGIREYEAKLTGTMQRVDAEVGRNATVNHRIYTSAQEQSVYAFFEGLVESLSVTVGTEASFSFNPAAPAIAGLRTAATLRQAAADVDIENANSKAVVRNLIIDFAELRAEMEVVVQEYNAQQTLLQSLLSDAQSTRDASRRSRQWASSNAASDPSFRLVRDSIRLQLAGRLERATRAAYIAAKRAEYEYAIDLSRSGFNISDIYRARTAGDVLDYLQRLENAAISQFQQAQLQSADVNLSIAQHILNLTDENLGLTGEEAELARVSRFREWVAQNLETREDGTQVLTFDFATSMDTNGVLARAMRLSADSLWVQKVQNVQVNLDTDEQTSERLHHRVSYLSQGGLTFLRARSGCILEYRLIAPAKLLGFEWPEGQNPEQRRIKLRSSINDNDGGVVNTELAGRSMSATKWTMEIEFAAPDSAQDAMDPAQLKDIDLTLGISFLSRQPVQPNPSQCVRATF